MSIGMDGGWFGSCAGLGRRGSCEEEDGEEEEVLECGWFHGEEEVVVTHCLYLSLVCVMFCITRRISFLGAFSGLCKEFVS